MRKQIGLYALLAIFAGSLVQGAEKKSMPYVAFNVLQTGDMKLAESILPTEEDAYAYIKRNKEAVEKRIGKSLTEEEMRKAAKKEAEKTRIKVGKQLLELRMQTMKSGIDLSKAVLLSVTDKSGKPYTEDKAVAKVDIYLNCKQGSKTLVVKLDDCIFGVSQRKLGDGYKFSDRLSPRSPIAHLFEAQHILTINTLQER